MFRTKCRSRALYLLKPVIELKRTMKAKIKTALKSNVDPFFFATACAVLLSVSMTAKALADDVLSAVDDSPDMTMMLTAEGQMMWHAE